MGGSAVHTGKAALAHGPHWLLVIIFVIGAGFMLSMIKDLHEDLQRLEDGTERSRGNALKSVFVVGFLVCVYLIYVFI